MDDQAMITAPASGTRLTYDDYLALPDDRNTYELIDGELFVNAAPNTRHQTVIGNLHAILYRELKARGLGKLFLAPTDILLDNENVVQPDLFFILERRRIIVEREKVIGPPDLVVEVLSPSTRQKDLTSKRGLYARFGVPHYWLFDPDANRATLYALENEDYRQIAALGAEDTLTCPDFPELSIPLREVFAD